MINSCWKVLFSGQMWMSKIQQLNFRRRGSGRRSKNLNARRHVIVSHRLTNRSKVDGRLKRVVVVGYWSSSRGGDVAFTRRLILHGRCRRSCLRDLDTSNLHLLLLLLLLLMRQMMMMSTKEDDSTRRDAIILLAARGPQMNDCDAAVIRLLPRHTLDQIELRQSIACPDRTIFSLFWCVTYNKLKYFAVIRSGSAFRQSAVHRPSGFIEFRLSVYHLITHSQTLKNTKPGSWFNHWTRTQVL